MMTQHNVLYDGWPLIYEPNSPAAIHLDLLLAQSLGDIRKLLAVPGELPDWVRLPDSVTLHVDPTPETPRGRIVWEQRKLSAIARRLQADLIHLTHLHPPLAGKIPTLVSPTANPIRTARRAGMTARLRSALGQGGMARVREVLWPADLPKPAAYPEPILLPPTLEAGYFPGAELLPPPGAASQLPETYLLYHGAYDAESLNILLAGWGWAAGSIGQLYPLVMAGVKPSGRESVEKQVQQSGLEFFCEVLSPLPIDQLPALYHGCAALFHPVPAAVWGSSLRQALACGRPVVTIENPLTDALVGPAGYVLPAGETRRLGAALITVVVEDSVAEKLGKMARAQAAPWQGTDFGKALSIAYGKVLGE